MRLPWVFPANKNFTRFRLSDLCFHQELPVLLDVIMCSVDSADIGRESLKAVEPVQNDLFLFRRAINLFGASLISGCMEFLDIPARTAFHAVLKSCKNIVYFMTKKKP